MSAFVFPQAPQHLCDFSVLISLAFSCLRMTSHVTVTAAGIGFANEEPASGGRLPPLPPWPLPRESKVVDEAPRNSRVLDSFLPDLFACFVRGRSFGESEIRKYILAIQFFFISLIGVFSIIMTNISDM